MNRVLDNTQKMCDKLKWEESEKCGYDKSGDMPYCEHCFYKDLDGFCSKTQQDREKFYLCATAYKRYVAKQREKKWLTR